MKKSLLWTVLIIALVLIGITLVFNIFYFQRVNEHIRPLTPEEKEKALFILNQTEDISGFEIEFKNLYQTKKGELAEIELKNGSMKKKYLIDLERGRIIRK